MPAVMTHNTFGHMAAKSLPGNILRTQDEKLAYILGNQGPDPFFFRCRTTPAKMDIDHTIASDLHSAQMSKSLDWLRRSVSMLPEEDRGIGRAFALGYLSHYILDKVTHPFIFAQQYATMAQDEDLKDWGGPIHAIIEADIDSTLVWRTYHKTILERSPYDAIAFTPRVTKIAGAMMSQVIFATLGIQLPSYEFNSAVCDMKFIYKMIEPVGSGWYNKVGLVESATGKYSQVKGLCHEVVHDGRSGWFNEEHYSWEHPFTHEELNDSFPDLFDEALELCPEACLAFLQGADTQSITGHINFSGEPLDDQESF